MQINRSVNVSSHGALESPSLEEVIVLADSAGVATGAPRAFSPNVRRVPHDLRAPIASRWVEIPLLGGDGEISGVLYRATTSETGGVLAAYRPKASRSIGGADQFVVHDITNLFAVIASGLRLLECQDDAAYRTAIVEKMKEAITRGALLSRQLLEKARLRANSIDEFINGDCFAATVATLDQALRLDIAVRTEIAPDLWDFYADPEELYFALLNLCRNSADAMPNGGVITVAARNIEASGAAGRGFVEIVVADDGEGMSEEVLSQAFNPYFTTKAAGRGTGLGLPQVQRFAERWGGAVGIESKRGAGTQVRLFLPSVGATEVPRSRVGREIGYRPTSDGGVFLVADPSTTSSAD